MIKRDGQIAFKGNRIAAQDVDAARQALESLVKSFAAYYLSGIQSKVILSQNFSNPFSPSTRIECHIPEDGWVRLTIYTLLGPETSTFIDRYQRVGDYFVIFEVDNLPRGIYF